MERAIHPCSSFFKLCRTSWYFDVSHNFIMKKVVWSATWYYFANISHKIAVESEVSRRGRLWRQESAISESLLDTRRAGRWDYHQNYPEQRYLQILEHIHRKPSHLQFSKIWFWQNQIQIWPWSWMWRKELVFVASISNIKYNCIWKYNFSGSISLIFNQTKCNCFWKQSEYVLIVIIDSWYYLMLSCDIKK